MKRLLLFIALLWAAPAFAQNYYLGPRVWAVDAQGNGAWRNPAGATLLIDLRTRQQRATPGPTASGVVLYQTSGTLSSPYALVGTGNVETSTINNTRRTAWENQTGYRPTSSTLAAVVWEHLTTGSDPAGSTRVRPLRPNSKSELKMRLGSFVRTEPFQLGVHAHTAKVEALHQLMYREVYDDAQAGRVPSSQPGRVLDMWTDQYKLNKADKSSWERLVPVDLRSSAVLVPHSTTITESFNGTDSDTVCADLTCTEVDGDWDRVSNKARLVSNFGSTMRDVRADSDLSSGDHYSQIVADNEGGTQSYVATNFSSSAETFYAYGLSLNNPASGTWEIWEVTAGTRSSLAVSSGTDTSAAGITIYGVNDGGDLELKIGGVSKLTVTDTSLTSVRCGFVGYDPSGVTGPEFDSLECADLAAAATHTMQRRIVIQ